MVVVMVLRGGAEVLHGVGDQGASGGVWRRGHGRGGGVLVQAAGVLGRVPTDRAVLLSAHALDGRVTSSGRSTILMLLMLLPVVVVLRSGVLTGRCCSQDLLQTVDLNWSLSTGNIAT